MKRVSYSEKQLTILLGFIISNRSMLQLELNAKFYDLTIYLLHNASNAIKLEK